VDAICGNPNSEAEFASGSHDHTIKLWDAPTCRAKGMLRGHDLGVWSLSYDSAGKRLISSSPDTSVKIWDAKNGKCTQTLRGHT